MNSGATRAVLACVILRVLGQVKMTELSDSPHVRRLSIDEASRRLAALRTPVSMLLRSVFNHKSHLGQNSPLLLASYSYGSPVAEWSYGDPYLQQRFTPCGEIRKSCIDCKELTALWSEKSALVLLLNKSAEAFLDTSAYSKITGQAPSVPIEILLPGQILGVPILTKTSKRKADFVDQIQRPLLKVTSGARSIFLGVPLNDQDLLPRVLILNGRLTGDPQFEIDFEKDSFALVKLLASALDNSQQRQAPWRLETMIIPGRVLQNLFREQPGFEAHLFSLLLAESESRYISESVSKRLILACSANLSVEARPHVNEILQIIAKQRLGYAPIESDSLGPFEAIQELIAKSRLMNTRTLRGRIPAILGPKKFCANGKPDFCYYSIRRPSLQSRNTAPTRISPAINGIAISIRKLTASNACPEVNLEFFASEKQPRTEMRLSVRPVRGDGQLAFDFAKQLEFGERFFSLDRSTALGDPRTGFLGHFVRMSNDKHLRWLDKKEKPLTLERWS